ncbi:MAG: DUF5666 domain-containing protein [Candidatus Adlerbacteria bacterium]
MKKINYYLATSTVAVALIAAAPLFASAHEGKVATNVSVKESAKTNLNIGAGIDHILFGTPLPNKDQHANGSINTSAVVTAINGSTLTVNAKGGTTYTVNAANVTVADDDNTAVSVSQIKVGDTVRIKGTVTGSTIVAEKISDSALRVRTVLAAHNAAGAGVVTSVNGSTFTIKPFGTQATTTVSAGSATVYRVNGDLASSSALTVGSKVVLAGNTNSDTSISATIVGIFTKGWSHFKHFFGH